MHFCGLCPALYHVYSGEQWLPMLFCFLECPQGDLTSTTFSFEWTLEIISSAAPEVFAILFRVGCLVFCIAYFCGSLSSRSLHTTPAQPGTLILSLPEDFLAILQNAPWLGFFLFPNAIHSHPALPISSSFLPDTKPTGRLEYLSWVLGISLRVWANLMLMPG